MRMFGYAASLTPNCAKCFVNNVGSVITGHSDGSSALNELGAEFKIPLTERDKLFEDADQFGQSGFAKIFQDSPESVALGGGNQALPFWFYVQVGFESGEFIGKLGVDIHEDLLGSVIGMSEMDRYLGYEGVYLGVLLREGLITPEEIEQYIIDMLGEDSELIEVYTDLYNLTE
jgi:hypothetical protein